ncbi:MAG: diguanylate cyclase [Clostridia bacterium]|nr:diguanylate cyclase [Clostridia bacterium]
MDILEKFAIPSIVILNVCCVAVIITVMAFSNNLNKKLHRGFSVWFYLMGSSLIVMMTSDVLFTILTAADVLDGLWFYLINSVYYIFQLFSAYALFQFAVDLTEFKPFQKWYARALFALPLLPAVYLEAASFQGHYVFYLNNVGDFVHGDYFLVHTLTAVFYLGLNAVFCAILLISRGKKKEKNAAVPAILLVFISIVTVFSILQMVTSFTFLSFAIAIALCFLFSLLMVDKDGKVISSLLFRERASTLIGVLSNEYMTMGYLQFRHDAKQDIFMIFRDSPLFSSVIPHWEGATSFRERLQLLTNDFVIREDREVFRDLVRREVVIAKLQVRDRLSATFRGMVDGKLRHYEAEFVGDRVQGSLVGALVSIRDVTEEMERKQGEHDSLEEAVRNRTEEFLRKNQSLRKMYESAVELIGTMAEGHGDTSAEHVRRIRGFTYLLATAIREDHPELHLTSDDVDRISSASVLHDLGMFKISPSIVEKPSALSDYEFEEIKKHPHIADEILKSLSGDWPKDFLTVCREVALNHHERWNGEGYPSGKKGNSIPLSAQIVSVADCFNALITEKPYRAAFSPEKAFEMILSGQCGSFSERILNAFERSKDAIISLASDSSTRYEEDYIGRGNGTLNDLRILLCDEDNFYLEMTREQLEAEGAAVETVEDGSDAVDMVRTAEPYYYDAILMDLSMEYVDGISASSAIRKIEKEWISYLPILALTEADTPETNQKSQEFGMNGILVKPISVQTLAHHLIETMKFQSRMVAEKMQSLEVRSNKDPLTGVQNIASYTDKVAEMTAQMATEKNYAFAVVEVDLNNLKRVNDAYGHEVGDIYIQNCAKILCDCFKHSPVYRTGGDEFIIILQGADYQLRDKLILRLQEMYKESVRKSTIENGKVAFAAGIAVYLPGVDTTVAEVVKKADTSMYHNKRLMKRDYRQTVS